MKCFPVCPMTRHWQLFYFRTIFKQQSCLKKAVCHKAFCSRCTYSAGKKIWHMSTRSTGYWQRTIVLVSLLRGRATWFPWVGGEGASDWKSQGQIKCVVFGSVQTEREGEKKWLLSQDLVLEAYHRQSSPDGNVPLTKTHVTLPKLYWMFLTAQTPSLPRRPLWVQKNVSRDPAWLFFFFFKHSLNLVS